MKGEKFAGFGGPGGRFATRDALFLPRSLFLSTEYVVQEPIDIPLS